MATNTSAFQVINPDPSKLASSLVPETPPGWLWGQGTPDGDREPFLSAQKGTLYSQSDATDDTPHVWVKVDEGNDDADWIVLEAGAGSISNADVAADAAIAYSKLATLADGNILVGSAAGVATSVNPSGDVDISNAGAFSIAAGVIVNADVSTSAAIVGSKLATNARREFARSKTFNIDNGSGTTDDDIILVPSDGITVVAVRAVYIEATDTAGVASANFKVGTTVGGAELVAATALAVSKAVGSFTAATLVSGAGAIAADGMIAVRHTGIAATEAGQYFVQVEYTVDD